LLEGELVETALGWSGLAFSPRGLRYLTFPVRCRDDARRTLEDLGLSGRADSSLVEPVAALLERFAEAKATDFSSVVVDIEGYSVFWQRAWAIIRTISWGQTLTYGGVAGLMGHPRAARAVGTATAHNPLAFVVPCHRVVASSGIGGYGGQEAFKAMLLKREAPRL
jgi:methylated-DNA-[protein]-cysteine S-methyltransferase